MKPSMLLDRARGVLPQIITLRRAIHAEPELGLHTPATCAKVLAALAHLPLEWREGPSSSGMLAVLRGRGSHAGGAVRRTVLLRGDMDALPMTEETGLPFASTVPGAMHACGHDTHTAMLAGAAEVLCADIETLPGDVMFMFQPGEEGFHGARFMLGDGLIDPMPDAAFALHVMPASPHGTVAGKAGPLLASADQFRIELVGAGGHASMPHQTLDPVPVACEVVTAIQTMVTRRFPVSDPVVATVARIEAGTTHNVIPDRAILTGTLRTLSAANRMALRESLETLATMIAAAHGMTALVTITPGFPVTICDPRAVDLGEAVARDIAGDATFVRLDHPIMGAEDFSYVLEWVPGAMFFLGAAPAGADASACCGIHSPRMVVDESVLPLGTALLAGCASHFLDQGFG